MKPLAVGAAAQLEASRKICLASHRRRLGFDAKLQLASGCEAGLSRAPSVLGKDVLACGAVRRSTPLAAVRSSPS